MDMNNSLNRLVHTVAQGGPVGPQGKEPLALLVLDHADPVGRYAVVQKKLLGSAGPKVEEPLGCWFLFMLTLLASVLLFTALRECGSGYQHSRNLPMVTD